MRIEDMKESSNNSLARRYIEFIIIYVRRKVTLRALPARWGCEKDKRSREEIKIAGRIRNGNFKRRVSMCSVDLTIFNQEKVPRWLVAKTKDYVLGQRNV